MADYTSSTSFNPSTTNNNAWTASNMPSTHASPVSATFPLDGFTQHTPQAPILSLALAVDIGASPASIDDTNITTGTPALFDSLNPDVNTIAVLNNTVAPQDFCLYERMDPSAFDFPLFGDSFKQQKLKQGGLFQNQLTDEELTLALDMQHQQQMGQLRYIQSHAIGSDDLSTAAAGTSFGEHPLISADMGFSSPMSTSASSNKVSFGFDSLAALMDDSALDLSHVTAAMTIQAQVPFHDHQHQHQQQTHVFYTPGHASDTPLLDAPSTPCLSSPFSPSLDTPAMPHLGFKFGGDFGCGDQIPLFGTGGPMFPFQLPMPIQLGHVMQSRGSGMVAPQSTLLNASPNPPAPLTFGGLCESECNLITSTSSSIKKEEEDTAKISHFSLSDLSTSSNSPLFSDFDDDNNSDDDDMDFKDDADDEDMEFFDVKSSAPDHSAATSSSNTVVSFVYSGKRKSTNDAPRPAASIALERHSSISGRDNDKGNDSEIDADDHQADSNYIPVATFIHNRKRKAVPAPASPFKRTRPTLASHYGGNNGSSSSLSSSSFATTKQQFDMETGPLSPLSNQDKSDNLPPAQRSSNKRGPGKKRPTSSDCHRPFVCDHPDCGRAFNRLFNLRSHVRTHDPNSERPFVCEADDCKKAFTRKHDLQRHETSVHQGQRRYVCDTCKKSFSRQDGLRRHYRREVNRCAPGQFEGVEGEEDHVGFGEEDHVGFGDEDDDDFSDASDTENRHSAT